jgi:hypothetical protein
MATSKLLIYNNALALLGERRLSNLYEDREPRYVLDETYNLELVNHCLEVAKPRFAVSSVKLASPAASSVHGLDSVYTLPADFISTLSDPGVHGSNGSFFADEDFQNPVDRYVLEGRTVATDIATNLWMRYITSGRSLVLWTPTFSRLVSAYLAKEIASRLNPSRIEVAEAAYEKALGIALSLEGVKENPILPQAAAASLSADQLEIYNATAALLGAAEFRHVDDGSALRLAIDSVYALAEEDLLETIKPKFATRVAALTGGAPSAVHGYDNVFSLPADFHNIVELWADEDLQVPITRFFIENTDIVVDGFSTAYLRYIIGTTAESAWSTSFKKAMAAYLAYELAPRFAPEKSGDLGQIAERRTGQAIVIEGGKEPSVRPLLSTYTLDNTTRQLYNKALQLLKLPPITSNTDESDRKVALDYAMNQKAVETVFELVSWGFLYKTVKLSNDDAVDPEFAYDYAFAVPSDMIRIDKISGDEYFRFPAEYLREGDYFFADTDEIYVRYLSNEQVTTPTTWPTYVFNLVAAELARGCGALPGADLQNAEYKYEEYKSEAYSTDAQRNPPEVISSGSWTRSRNTWPTRRTQRP